MFAATALRLTSRKWALRLYQAEQLKGNTTLDGLSAIQKRKVIMRMFKALPDADMESLKTRSISYQQRVEAGDATPLAATTGTPASGAVSKRNEITPYEFFVREQRGNPAISSLINPRAQEVKLLEIYNSLPDKAREALEQRANDFNTKRAVAVTPSAGRVLPVKRAKSAKKAKKSPRPSMKRKKAAQKSSGVREAAAKSSTKIDKAEKKRKGVVSPYAVFVKENMASVGDMPQKEKMKEIGRRWKALSEAERHAILGESKTATAPKVPEEATSAVPLEEAKPSPMPDPTEAPKATEASVPVEEPPKVLETGEVSEAPKAAETPKVEETPKAEETPKTAAETSKMTESLKTQEPVEASKVSKVQEAPKTSEIEQVAMAQSKEASSPSSSETSVAESAESAATEVETPAAAATATAEAHSGGKKKKKIIKRIVKRLKGSAPAA